MKSNQRGMTLLEIMISVAIMAVLSLYTSKSIQSAVKAKQKIQTDIDRYSEVRDVLRIMERDINLAFNYKDTNVELYNEAQIRRRERDCTDQPQNPPNPDADKNPEDQIDGENGGNKGDPEDGDKDNSQPGQSPSNQKPAYCQEEFKPKELKILTQFIGLPESLNFTSLNNIRSRKDAQESDQMEVGYYIETCRGRLNKEKSSSCLWRRTAKIIDDDVEEGGDAMVLVENVEAFELRYLGPQHEEDWIEQWRTDESGDATTKGTFPYAVEVTLETHNKDIPNSKKTRMTMVAALRFPNNEKVNEKEEQQNEQTTEPKAQ